MNLKEAVERACQEPTLVKALAFMAIWENDRAVRQAMEWHRTGISTAKPGQGWDTTFEYDFNELIKAWKGAVYVPPGCRELQFDTLGALAVGNGFKFTQVRTPEVQEPKATT